MRKKNDVKKKKHIVGSRLPICCFESRYSRLYRDTAGMGAQGMGHDMARSRPQHSLACATIRCAARAIQPSARAGGLASGECRDTKIVSWLGAAFVSQ